MKIRNYTRLTDRSLFFRSYLYVESTDYISASLFSKYRVRVSGIREMAKPGETYHYIICKVRRRDEEKFLTALSELSRLLLVRGETEYPAACREMLAMLKA